MGQQQFLLIVLAIIVIGVAISVGISLFINQSYINNQQSCAAELQNNYCTLSLQYYKTPKAQGGAGQDSTEVTVEKVASFLGFHGPNHSLLSPSDNGEFRVTNTTGSTVTLKALGTEEKNGKRPFITSIVHLRTGEIISSTSAATAF